MSGIKHFFYSLFVVGLTAAASAWFVQSGMTGWYQMLAKPSYTPPSQWFAVIWSLLYVLMAVSYYLILGLRGNPRFKQASDLFFAQLILQIVWTFAFFHIGYLGAALLAILLLDYIVCKMIAVFRKISPAAGYLQYPYLLWLLYATCLNISFVYLNGFIVGI